MKQYDLIVIGSGPGGYVAAIEASQLGKKVAVVERKAIGGTCLNVGCIPSKAYLKHASWMEEMQTARQFGINAKEIDVDFSKLVKRKDDVVVQLQTGIHSLFKQHGIDFYEGKAEIPQTNQVQVGEQILQASYILLATGSRPFVPPIKGLDETSYLTTDTFFELKEQPDNLIIIGGGVIGVELAFAMAPLGTSVTIVEVADDILMTEDDEARTLIKKRLKELSVSVITKATIKEVKEKSLYLSDESLNFDELLVVTGRQANLELVQQLHLETTERDKYVKVNHYYQTSNPSIYAVGDMVDSYMLAHAASKEGIKAVRHMFGKKERRLLREQIPRCVYTHPEIASFGLNEQEATAAGYDVKVGKIPYAANGRAIAGQETTGYIKIISERRYDEILGAVIVGSNATELIHTILAVKESEGTLAEIEKMTFAHPTLSEMMGELGNQMIE
ncbi:dihydrolipoyl dehydrogenase [Vagococcus lutrae]|uniref:dihydrolipoyl dehydrogenase n=1 Tax=Vagococcus lutrae TaxID=81947 RepID=UPI00289219CB|nr:dihydrolipoyl dehydrogenase [Vagococcus lutrae]MDT2824681.1 dihydrolipoyl dehydrogenase [Vagococcus lutrae]